jgi:hypothetical protein
VENPLDPNFSPPPAAPPAAGAFVQRDRVDGRIIFLLNFILLGVGYFVLGQWKKGVATLLTSGVIGVITLGYGLPVVALIAGIDGARQARRVNAGTPIGQWTWF